MTPRDLTGLWRRVSVTVGDGAPHEPASVHWLQWGDRFVDLRVPVSGSVPLSGPGAFGGTTTWDDPVLTWHHELDSAGSGAPADAGHLTCHGGRLVERGSFDAGGETVEYVEVWERVTSASAIDGRSWSPAPGCLALEVGGHRMAVIVDGDHRWAGARAVLGPQGRWSLEELSGDEALADDLRTHLLGGARDG